MMRLIREVAANARMALAALAGNRLRSVVTLLSIGIGVATLIAIFSVIQGLNRGFHDQLSKLGLSALVVSRWPLVPTSNQWWKYMKWPKIGLADVHAIQEQS